MFRFHRPYTQKCVDIFSPNNNNIHTATEAEIGMKLNNKRTNSTAKRLAYEYGATQSECADVWSIFVENIDSCTH